MIYANEYLGRDSTVPRGTFTVEISGILKSLRVVGRRRKMPKKKGILKWKEKRKKSKKKR